MSVITEARTSEGMRCSVYPLLLQSYLVCIPLPSNDSSLVEMYNHIYQHICMYVLIKRHENISSSQSGLKWQLVNIYEL